MNTAVRPRRVLKSKYKDMIFYGCLIAYPLIQFAIFYVGVNINSVLIAFQDIDAFTGVTVWSTKNFTEAVVDFFTDASMLKMLKTSFVTYLLSLVTGTPLGLLFSYYMAKKFPLAGAFRVILFLPSIISNIVMVTIYNYFVERAIPEIVKLIAHVHIDGMLENPVTRYGTLFFFGIWAGFGSGVLIYTNGMSGISQDVVDSAHIDGATGIKEFWHITMPGIYNTFATFFYTGIAGIFTNQFNLYSFYGVSAPTEVRTYGYSLYLRTTQATTSEYPALVSLGLIMTLIVAPITLIVKRLMEKYGPSED